MSRVLIVFLLWALPWTASAATPDVVGKWTTLPNGTTDTAIWDKAAPARCQTGLRSGRMCPTRPLRRPPSGSQFANPSPREARDFRLARKAADNAHQRQLGRRLPRAEL